MDQIIESTEKFKDGSPILHEGTWAFYAYVLKSGKANVWKNIHNKQVLVGTLKEGDIFGEMSFIGGSKRTATVTAVGDVEVGMIPKDTFTDAIQQLPPSVRSKLDLMVSNLTCISEVDAHLINRLQQVKDIETKIMDIKTFEEEIEKMPKLLRQVVIALAQRLNTAIERCEKLAIEVEEAIHAVDAISVALTKK